MRVILLLGIYRKICYNITMRTFIPKFFTGQTVHTIIQKIVIQKITPKGKWFYNCKGKIKQIGIISNMWTTLTKYELENGEQVFEDDCFITKKQAEEEVRARNKNIDTLTKIGGFEGMFDTSQMTVKVNSVEIK